VVSGGSPAGGGGGDGAGAGDDDDDPPWHEEWMVPACKTARTVRQAAGYSSSCLVCFARVTRGKSAYPVFDMRVRTAKARRNSTPPSKLGVPRNLTSGE